MLRRYIRLFAFIAVIIIKSFFLLERFGEAGDQSWGEVWQLAGNGEKTVFLRIGFLAFVFQPAK